METRSKAEKKVAAAGRRPTILDIPEDEFNALTTVQLAAAQRQIDEAAVSETAKKYRDEQYAKGYDYPSMQRRWKMQWGKRYADGECCGLFDSADELAEYNGLWCEGEVPCGAICIPCWIGHTVYLTLRPIWRCSRKACCPKQ